MKIAADQLNLKLEFGTHSIWKFRSLGDHFCERKKVFLPVFAHSIRNCTFSNTFKYSWFSHTDSRKQNLNSTISFISRTCGLRPNR